jgi:hypothetical protein
LENAVSKSQFIGQGKKLKGVTKVCLHRDNNHEILHKRQFCANDARAGQP